MLSQTGFPLPPSFGLETAKQETVLPDGRPARAAITS